MGGMAMSLTRESRFCQRPADDNAHGQVDDIAAHGKFSDSLTYSHSCRRGTRQHVRRFRFSDPAGPSCRAPSAGRTREAATMYGAVQAISE